MNILKLLSPPSLHATFALFTILISGAPQKEQDPQEREIRMAKRQHLQLWHGQWDKGLAISLPPPPTPLGIFLLKRGTVSGFNTSKLIG